jgi:hypothetical protein
MRISRVLLQEVAKKSTNLVGIPVHTSAKPALASAYNRILHNLTRLPAESHYRMGTESIMKERLEMLSSCADIKSFEEQVGAGQVFCSLQD